MALAQRPRVFIGSTAEHLELSRGVHKNLERETVPTIWSHGVFKPSEYPLDVLSAQLDAADYGVFILAPADVETSRHRRRAVPRDNVIFEAGMSVGRLGRRRTFIIVPRGEQPKLPSDLHGLIPGDYDPERGDGNLEAALEPACRQILKQIAKDRLVSTLSAGVVDSQLFPDFSPRFRELLNGATTVKLFFIHSRRWREQQADPLHDFLSRARTKLTVFLPDTRERGLIETISAHFDDEPAVPGLIEDARRFFAILADEFPKKVTIRLFKQYPAFSAYVFDERCIVALYPNSRKKRAVPSFEFLNSGPFGAFVSDDLAQIEKRGSRKPAAAELRQMRGAERR